MAWSDLVDKLDTTTLKVFGIPATLNPQSGGSPIPLTGIIQTPAMAEDFIPGSTQGVTVVRFFVRYADLSPQPQKGDTLTLNGVTYSVFEVAVDVEGGAILKLRRNA